MSLNLTYADNADSVHRHRRQTAGLAVRSLLFLMLGAAALGVVFPDPIGRWY